jgi:uncharacterized protein YcnI
VKVTRIAALAVAAGATTAAGALTSPVSAQAHVSIHPNTIPAGALATLDVRVPGEQEGAYVKSVDMLLPPAFTSVAYANVPGWSVRLVNRKLASPIQTDDGPVDEQISQILWTWTGPEGRVNDDQFVDFPLSVAIPDVAGQALRFKTIQTYSNRQVVRWIDSSLTADNPAPTVNVTTKGGMIEDVAGEEAGPTPGQAATGGSAPASGAAVARPGDTASKSLSIVAVILGALGLVVALGALAATRRARVGGR